MTDNEIIKALERLSAENPDGFSADVLEVVNRLKKEIEKLEKARQKQGQFLAEERGQKYELMEANRILTYQNKQCDETIKELQEQINGLHAYENKIKIAAYKDFADMVRDTFFYDISNSTPKEAKFPCAVMYAIEKEIDKALKEMVGEDE